MIIENNYNSNKEIQSQEAKNILEKFPGEESSQKLAEALNLLRKDLISYTGGVAEIGQLEKAGFKNTSELKKHVEELLISKIKELESLKNELAK